MIKKILKNYILLVFFIFINLSLFPNQNSFISLLGEKLTYKVTWFNISAGHTVISLKEIIFEGKKALEFQGIVTSAKWFSRIYYVEDRIVTIVDYNTLKPIMISLDYREGKKYRRKSKYIFDYKKNIIIVEGDKKAFKEPLPENFMEVFSAFYSMRMFNFENSKNISQIVTDGRKIYTVKALFKGFKTIDSILGEKRCIVILPQQIQMDLLGANQDPDSLSIYITYDSKRIPLRAEGKIRIGSLLANLEKIEKI